MKPVILTGLRANNGLHIGNYLGALLPLIDMARKRSDEYQINLFVPDLHSFTTPIDHSKLYEQILQNIRVYAAAGLPLTNPNVHIYRQSYVPAHSELTWVLDCFTGFGEMSRMTQFKDKSGTLQKESALKAEFRGNTDKLMAELKAGRVTLDQFKDGVEVHKQKAIGQVHDNQGQPVTMGLFNYPVLMAADILLYNALYVPVGDDQTQHLEFTRNIAERINNRFGNVFTVPAPVPKQHEFFGKDQGLRVKDLLDPTKKMSKSDESGKGVIFLTDSPEVATKKIMSATTDSFGQIKYDPAERPGISNLLQLLSLFDDRALKDVAAQYEGQTTYGDLKKDVARAVGTFLQDFQAKLAKVDDAAVLAKLESSEASMREQANATLLKVQRAVGVRPKRTKEEPRRAGRVTKPAVLGFEDYAKADIRIGTVIAADAVEGSDKLISLSVDFGSETRTIVTGMHQFHKPESLIGRQLPFVVNLKSQTLKGITSQGMLMAVETGNGPILLSPSQPVPNGSPLE